MKPIAKLIRVLVIAFALAAVQVQAQCGGGRHHGAAWTWTEPLLENLPTKVYDAPSSTRE